MSQTVMMLRLSRNSYRFNINTVKQFSSTNSDCVQIKNLDSEYEYKSESTKDQKSKRKTKLLKKEFESLCSWKDQSELVSELQSNIVYHEPQDKTGLVVLNKPYGLPKTPSEDCQYSLESSLPHLADQLGVKNLSIVKASERFSSGITILGSNDQTEKFYKRAMTRCNVNRIMSSSYIALVKGSASVNKHENVDMRLKECPEVANPLFSSMHKEPVISRYLVKQWKLQRDKIRRVSVHAESVARSSSGVSVMSVSSSFAGKHFLQVYLADLGHPVLGDMMYDYRTRTIMGQRIRITSHTNARRTQLLPFNILELLGLQEGEEWMIPKFLHKHRIHLPGWLEGKKDLTVFAPPPQHWTRTLQTLGVNFSYKEFAESDKPSVKDLNTERAEKKRKKKEDQQQVLTDLQASVAELP